MPAIQSSSPKTPKGKKVIKFDKKPEPAQKSSIVYDPEELIFALDIGTRTVIGILGIPENGKFKIIASDIIEHKKRAMLDGQIHDIGQVAEIAKEVKTRIEKKVGVKLSKVSIAAAGRVLKTCEVKVEREIEFGKEIDHETVASVEMEGIQRAQMKLDEEISHEDQTHFYCVGYSIVNYYLNDYIIASPVGHKGRKIGVDVLATFLPHIVVDSLYTVMAKIGLEVVSLTLEPIAAINVTIPRDLRLLNLALVDVGAGTSDIALTKDGSVIAYAMAPVAGDEITEKIAQYYLVDFNTAEKIKISMSGAEDSVIFVDILRNKQIVKKADVYEAVKPTIEFLALTISQRILEYNHKAPNAVFLIGGGSQIPGLQEMIAEQLKLPKERVAVRGRDIIQNIRFSGRKLSGPEAITPIGIAVTAHMQKGQDFLSVSVNGKKIRLFNSKKLAVADALILVGFNANQLIGRSGKSMSFILNGTKKTIKGEYGKAAEIFVNEKPANLETILKIGDNIRITPAEDGTNAESVISDFIRSQKSGNVIFNGSEIDIGTKAYINGRIVMLNSPISEGDSVMIIGETAVKDLMKNSELNVDEYDVFVNEKEAGSEYLLNDSDIVKCVRKTMQSFSIPVNSLSDINDEIKSKNSYTDTNNDVFCVIINGNNIPINGSKKQYIFVDMFNFINFDLSQPQGNIVIKLNGKQAAFTDEIKAGDIIDIFWEK